MTLKTHRSLKLWAARLLMAAVLAGVFLLYTRPGFMQDVSNWVWACFA